MLKQCIISVFERGSQVKIFLNIKQLILLFIHAKANASQINIFNVFGTLIPRAAHKVS